MRQFAPIKSGATYAKSLRGRLIRARPKTVSKAVKILVVLGVGGGAFLTALGLFANWFSFLDLINDGLPFLFTGCLLLVAVALVIRGRFLIAAAALLAVVNGAVLVGALQEAAPAAAPGSARFMRVATFNLSSQNDRMEDVAAFLAASDADVIVLEETTSAHLAELRQALNSRYPHILGEWSIVILSKHPIVAHGRSDPPGYPPWVSPMARWARIEVKGVAVEIVGVHLTRPFYPAGQDQDYAALTAFVRSRDLPLVVAGDFNATPWTVKFADLIRTTELAPHNTLYPTWPTELLHIPVLPLFPTDNIATSREFTALGAEAGPRLGSDHRPFIADIALSEPRRASAKLHSLFPGRAGTDGLKLASSWMVCPRR